MFLFYHKFVLKWALNKKSEPSGKKRKHMLEKICSVCGSEDSVGIETVTNVIPQPEEMFPVLLCVKHKKALQDRLLDITLDKVGTLNFIVKKRAS